MSEAKTVQDRAEEMRAFNRFYTGELELLNEKLLQSDFTLTETRILFELATRGRAIARELVRDLRIDAGYLSRILTRFERVGLIARTPSREDARQSELALTAKGRSAFAPLAEAARRQALERLEALPKSDQTRLVTAMSTIRHLLEGGAATPGTPILRALLPGDIGWVTHRQARLYHEEYGWDRTYEALVAQILGEFGTKCDPVKEQAWIAEADDRIVGSIFLMKASDELAKLRLLYVEPDTRGMGLGRQLVEQCITGARIMGYSRMTLWTQSILTGARRIYAQAGFEKVHEEPHHSFGHDLIGETWEMDL